MPPKNQATELSEKLEQLDDEKSELEAQKFDFQAEKAEFKAKQLEWELAKKKGGSSSSAGMSDRDLKGLKAKLDAEREQLEAEKRQLRTAQFQLQAAQSQLGDAKTQLEDAKTQLETARAHLEDAMAETVINNKKLEAARASLQGAKIRFDRATKQMNAAKSKFEAAKKSLEAASGDKDSKANDELAAELGQSKAQVESLSRKLRDLEDQSARDKRALQETVDELAAELGQSKAQVESLSRKLRDLEDQSARDKRAWQETVDELKKKLLDQGTKNATDAAAELSKSKTQVESLSWQLRDQESRCGREKKALQEKLDDLKKKLPDQSVNPKVFFDITINSTSVGRIVIELFADTTPRVVENFRVLCTGEKGFGRNGKPLHYKGTTIFPSPAGHNEMIYGGGIAGKYGDGESIYGETQIVAENFIKKHTGQGDVVMYFGDNAHRTSHGTDFYITMVKLERWDGHAVVIGHVVEGMNLLAMIANAGDDASKIANCGQVS